MDLPYELSEQIITYLAPRDLISMCLVHSSHLKTARKYLYRDVSAPLSLAGIQRLLEISRDPELSLFVRTLKYPTHAAILIKDIHQNRPGLLSDETPVLGDDSTDIDLDKKIPEEYLELVKANNRKCKEQRRLLFSREHKEILKEALGNLPNLKGLNLQFGCFKVEKALQPLVKSAWCNQALLKVISGEGNCADYCGFTLRSDFIESMCNTLSDILQYPRIPVTTLYLEGAGTLPRLKPQCFESENRLKLKREWRDIRTLCLRLDPVMVHVQEYVSRANFFPSGGFLGKLRRLQKFSVVVTRPSQQTSDLPLYPLKSFGWAREYRSHPVALVHTLELEGVGIKANHLLRFYRHFRRGLKFLILRRISLYYDCKGWKDLMKGMKETERKSPRLERCEIEDVYEEWEERCEIGVYEESQCNWRIIVRKLSPEDVQKMVDYLLGGEDHELVLDY